MRGGSRIRVGKGGLSSPGGRTSVTGGGVANLETETMRAYRLLSLSALLVGLSALTACGGGGGGGASPGVGTAALTGRVTLRDGTSSNLGGIVLTMPRTGRTIVTAPDGSFSFGAIPTGTITIRLLSTAATVSTQGGGADDGPNHDVGDDNGGNGDGVDDNGGDDVNDDNGVDAIDDDANDDGDDNDTGDDDFDVVGITDGEKLEIRLRVNGDVIESVDCSRSNSDDREAEVRMTRSVDSDDADVTGEIETESRTDRQRLKIEVEHLTVGRVVKAILTLAGVEADLGSRTADAFGEVEWDLNTNDGDVLPHGVTTVAELAGADVRVEDAGNGTILTFGTVPETPAATDGDGDGSDDDSDDDDGHGEGRARLTRASGAVGEAYVEVSVRPDQGDRQRFKAEIDHQTAGLEVDVWLEDPANLGTLSKIGSITVGSEGEGELELDTHEGAGLPYGVASVQSLVGLQVELRTTADVVLFSGLVPTVVTD